MDHSITYERQFYAISTIRDTCWAIIHAAIGKCVFANTKRPGSTQFLRRILVWSLLEYERVVNGPSPSIIHRPASVHRMDPRSMEGLLDIVALGNLLEFLQYLDSRYYTKDMPPSEEAEADHTRLAFFRFKRLFCGNQHLLIDARRADPMRALFDLSTIRMAVTLVKYKERKATFDGTFTLLQLKQSIMKHFSKYSPHLLPQYEHDAQCRRQDLPYLRSFDWTGPKFEIAESAYVDRVSLQDEAGPSVAFCYGSGNSRSTISPGPSLCVRKRYRGAGMSV